MLASLINMPMTAAWGSAEAHACLGLLFCLQFHWLYILISSTPGDRQNRNTSIWLRENTGVWASGSLVLVLIPTSIPSLTLNSPLNSPLWSPQLWNMELIGCAVRNLSTLTFYYSNFSSLNWKTITFLKYYLLLY